MSFSFLPSEMTEDLVDLSRTASGYLAPRSQARLERFAQAVGYAAKDALGKGQEKFHWCTPEDEPIQIAASRQWKGGEKLFAPMTAEITADYVCRFIDGGPRVNIEGVCVVRIHNADKSKEKVVHFDVEPGGWERVVNDKTVERAGHPAFHVQFYGMINDLPRLPSLVVHPVDVIALSILELHQKRWREHVGSIKGRTDLRHLPLRQRKRLGDILTHWGELVANQDFPLALVAMQSEIPPLAV